MAEDPLGALFDRYRREGDLAALASVFEAVGPELLRLARHLRPSGQAPEDLVQSTFLAALQHNKSYELRRPIRPWLLGILLNKAAARRRPEHELAAELEGRESPEDEVRALESARLLARGLERLPAIYSEVLRAHFFAGLPPGEIAVHLGRPPGTVRAQLHRGLRLLRGLLPAGMAGWLAWLGPSRASLLRVRRAVLDEAASELAAVGVPAGAPPLAGARLAGASAVAVAGLLGLRAWTAEPPQETLPEEPSVPAMAADQARSMRTAVAPTQPERDAVIALAPERATDAATHGALLLRVLYPDGSPAEAVGLRVYAWGESSWRDNRTDGVTDAAGELAIERIHAGRVGIYCDRGGDQGFGATVEAGTRTVREIALPLGVHVAGEVVDARGTPVARAGIWLSEAALPSLGRIAAQCDERGRFELRDVSPRRFLGARAPGFAPSEIEWLGSGGLREGCATQVRIVLPDAGGSIAGTVVDAKGEPVPGATVVVRASAGRGARLRADGALLCSSTPIEVASDERGRFAFADLAFSELELTARAQGHPEQTATAQLTPQEPHGELELRLQTGGRLRGTVRYADGEPAVGAVVIASNAGRGTADREVDERGEYALDGLAPGTLDLQAGFGHAAGGQVVQAELWLPEAGEITWDAIVERPSDFTGRVLGPLGEPLSGAWVRAVPTERKRASAPLPEAGDALAEWLHGWPERYVRQGLEQVAADAEGRFTLIGVPHPFAIEVRWPDDRAGWPARVFDPAPGTGELALLSDSRHCAALTGTIAQPQGQPMERGEVFVVQRAGGEVHRFLEASGAFRFESLPQGTYDVLVWARGFLPRIVATATLAEGEQRDLGWLPIAP